MSRVFQGCRVLMAATKSGAKSVVASSGKPMNTGFNKPQRVSPALKKIVGVPEISRAQVMKKIWDHIKDNGLQNPTNKREIRCDDKLKSIFDGKDTIGMLEIPKFLNPHFLK